MVLEFLLFKFGIRAFIGGLIVAVTCASLGVFIVLRRLSLIADGLGHVAFGGIALGFWTGRYPLYTAVASVIAGSLGIHGLGKLRVASDAAIAIMFSAGLAIGVVLISLAQSAPADLLSYLFGTILGINDNDVYLAAVLGVIVLAVIALLWKEWIGITLDPDFARVAGMPVTRLEILFTILVGLTVVVACHNRDLYYHGPHCQALAAVKRELQVEPWEHQCTADDLQTGKPGSPEKDR